MLSHWSEDCTSLVKNEISKFLEDPYIKIEPDGGWAEVTKDIYLPIYADIGGYILLYAETGELFPLGWDDEQDAMQQNAKLARNHMLDVIQMNALFLAGKRFPKLFDALHFIFMKTMREMFDE